ncbi:holo-ACP synthase [Gammaproteobacteria bacterium]|jgi:holo-[acyl-carrier protein] synthase|nr:holo-[acyl-carrier-protein] synthase [Gammaproteobacteria bacterium]MDA9736376.1 holo-ACP synthase [Gammaproteobacteria bacterium]MEC8314438.1 holo-ACP synthase [Pseudomonadota bacterium]MEC8448767.1 holo-ACP synthase [Pseudomonadota bacterium]MED5348896.1 holo-ACP synthase [Pseudomonadota bacterium]|tara:strand:- start:3374 stop:3754 length:381 start_codon:yes stop_codon:yes gene_type:complete
MINGVGVDILEKERVFTIHKKYGKRFQERVLGDSEIKAIEGKSLNNQIRFISNNFACKEAVAKALGLGFTEGISLKEIEILRKPSGQPFITLNGNTDKVAKNIGIKKFHVSISDTKKLSMAFVVGE